MNVLEFRGVALGDEEKTFIRGLDLALRRGEKLVVFGRSGAGKRTFLKLAAGVVGPSAGSVTLDDPRRPVGYVTQEGGLLNNLTLVQNAALPAVYHKRMTLAAAEHRARGLLAEWGISADSDRRPPSVTAASRCLAQLARAVVAEPALFVLDDPLEDLDAATAAPVKKALGRILGDEEASVIVGTEKPGPYLDRGGRFLLLREGSATAFDDRKALAGTKDPEARMLLDQPAGGL